MIFKRVSAVSYEIIKLKYCYSKRLFFPPNGFQLVFHLISGIPFVWNKIRPASLHDSSFIHRYRILFRFSGIVCQPVNRFITFGCGHVNEHGISMIWNQINVFLTVNRMSFRNRRSIRYSKSQPVFLRLIPLRLLLFLFWSCDSIRGNGLFSTV